MRSIFALIDDGALVRIVLSYTDKAEMGFFLTCRKHTLHFGVKSSSTQDPFLMFFFLLMNSAIIRWEFLFLFFFKNGTFALERRFLPIKSPLLRLPAFPPISNLKDSLNEAKVVKLLKPTPLFTYMMDLNHVFLNNYAPFWIVANKSGAVWGSVIKELKPWGVAFHPVRTGSAPRGDADTRVHTFGQIPPIIGSDIWSAVGDVPPLVIPGCDHSC